ncbi:hypothetical protein CROQUDRAFT_722640 [Cronartium quercuum f. sp. fusiforme G11]|uniref:Manganese/iron superoxide dismutase C-terminal domain-containing protein n=1 Tax=Cronartium quercuum f. sp. fusiforme G11 TaxID=708437 RepID=A0A9P6TDL0_9BASI|nr:hypothetical protein CROQUDRAFT_722640 [Cronartium quercuum f. sp. fusiforme G11]
MKPSGSVQQIITSTHLQLPRAIPSARRLLHVPPPVSSLPFSLENGVPPFLSAKTLKTLAIDWQTGLLDRLNQKVQGTAAEHLSLFDSIIHLAKDRTQVSAFNLASEALNNSFFLNGLRKPSSDQLDTNWPTPGSALARAMDDTYGSYTQFVSYFSSAANGMTTSGYLWLTCDQDGLLGICPTFASGTILVQNRQQRGDWPSQLGSSQTTTTGPVSPSTSTPTVARAFSTSTCASAPLDGSSASHPRPRPASFADSLFSNPTGPSSTPASFTIPNRAITRRMTEPVDRFAQVHPLLALAVAERAYMPDYGIWGKELYLKNFWAAVDWSKVEKAYASRCEVKPELSKGW